MLMVVMLHHGSHGGLVDAYPVGSMNHIFVRFFEQLCMPAVNIFVLISGYFLCQSRIKILKAVNLYTQIWSYSIAFYLAFLFKGTFEFKMQDFLMAIFPISYGSYWFASHYLVLYLSIPILNCVISELKKKEHLILIIVSIMVFCVVNDLTLSGYNLSDGGYSQLWMFVLYFIAAYIRKYINVSDTKKRVLVFTALGAVLIQTCMYDMIMSQEWIVGLFQKNVFDVVGITILIPLITFAICAMFETLRVKLFRITKISSLINKAGDWADRKIRLYE